ncbi:MAG: radical SAM protein [Deltaproteobacteria bacterium]|nr:radical SAM protein [Deltaproteobacteria bacterium]
MAPLPFKITFKNNQFLLEPKVFIDAKVQSYLQHYLDRASLYKRIGSFQNSPVLSLYQAPLASPVGARALWMRAKRRFENKRIPATATVAVNRHCQCLCEHCSALFYNQASKSDLPLDQLQTALHQAVHLGVTNLILLGGEPLLRKDLIHLIEKVDAQKSVVTLFSNGEFIDNDRAKALQQAGLMGVFISIDSPQADTHDALRRRAGLFQKALQGIENLLREGLLVAISSYLSPARVQEGILDEMMELGKKLGVHELTFFDAIPSGKWLHHTEQLLQEKDRQIILNRVLYYRKQPTYPGISAQSTLTSKSGSAFCFAGNTQFYLTAHGEMCPCDFTPLSVGKFPEESIETLWNKMIQSEPYCNRAKSCRMQDAEFRKKYIDGISAEEVNFPIPLLD